MDLRLAIPGYPDETTGILRTPTRGLLLRPLQRPHARAARRPRRHTRRSRGRSPRSRTRSAGRGGASPRCSAACSTCATGEFGGPAARTTSTRRGTPRRGAGRTGWTLARPRPSGRRATYGASQSRCRGVWSSHATRGALSDGGRAGGVARRRYAGPGQPSDVRRPGQRPLRCAGDAGHAVRLVPALPPARGWLFARDARGGENSFWADGRRRWKAMAEDVTEHHVPERAGGVGAQAETAELGFSRAQAEVALGTAAPARAGHGPTVSSSPRASTWTARRWWSPPRRWRASPVPACSRHAAAASPGSRCSARC